MRRKEHYSMERSAQERVSDLEELGIRAWYRREPAFSFLPWCVEYDNQEAAQSAE